jgi:hypothetical protein
MTAYSHVVGGWCPPDRAHGSAVMPAHRPVNAVSFAHSSARSGGHSCCPGPSVVALSLQHNRVMSEENPEPGNSAPGLPGGGRLTAGDEFLTELEAAAEAFRQAAQLVSQALTDRTRDMLGSDLNGWFAKTRANILRCDDAVFRMGAARSYVREPEEVVALIDAAVDQFRGRRRRVQVAVAAWAACQYHLARPESATGDAIVYVRPLPRAPVDVIEVVALDDTSLGQTYLPPPGFSPAQVEVYVALRHDDVKPEAAAVAARAL